MNSFLKSAILVLLGFSTTIFAQAPKEQSWRRLEHLPDRPAQDRRVEATAFHAFEANPGALQRALAKAPKESTDVGVADGAEIMLPMPDGSLARFRLVEAPVMAPELAAKFPEIKTYLGQGIDDPAALVRFDSTPAGFHAQILSPKGAIYIDPPFHGDATSHISYYKRDYQRAADGFQCLVGDAEAAPAVEEANREALLRAGASLRTYRLACAATGEYTAFHGGTVSGAMSAIVTAINRVTGIYERDLAVRLVLIPNNDLLVYTNAASDPYNNNDGVQMLGQNQSNVDNLIGNANYDIGHVFSTGGGGIAGLGVVCRTSNKARGVTGLPTPTGDPFYVDYVAHEIGHQFGANHTFNSITLNCGGGNRNAGTAYEPGSGSTIMAYAGICGTDNLQGLSDPYFHSVSFDEILTYTTSGLGGGCPVVTSTGNSAPAISAGANFTIPANTPFALTAAATDAEGDPLTFCWEERDLGAAQAINDPDNGTSPLFRSHNPTPNPTRLFPKLANILNNSTSLGEKLPTTTRTMNFRVTARDNRPGGGGVNTSDMQITVSAGAGPFRVTAPPASVTWSNLQSVTWDVAGTTGAPINAAAVNILLSTDNGGTFPFVLATNTPNDGSQTVLLPNIISTNARIKVEANGNIFFDISDGFTLTNYPPVAILMVSSATLVSEACLPGNSAIDPSEIVTVNVTLTNLATVDATNVTATLAESGGVNSPSGAQNYGAIAAGTSVTRPFTFLASGICGGNLTATLGLDDSGTALPNVSHQFVLGTTTLGSISFTNAAQIKVPSSGTSGTGSPYPASITVAGLSGTVGAVTVTLVGVNHTVPDDIDILLVGPGGQKVVLMSDAGGSADLSGVTLTFDDNAASMLPDNTLILSGTYRPSNFGLGDPFSFPAPSGAPAATLSTFAGTSPNGVWSLYIEDDASADKGTIASGWQLSLATMVPDCCDPANTAPTISSISDQTIVEDGSTGPIAFTIGDSETPASSLTVSGASSDPNLVPPANIGFGGSGANRTVTVTPAANLSGTATITVEVNDGHVTTPATFTVTVDAINDAPVLTAISNRAVGEGTSILFTNVVSDADLDSLSFSLQPGAPAGATLNPTTGVFSWTPDEDQGPSTNSITVIVTDNGVPVLSDSKTFSVVVNEVNSTPVLDPILNATITEGETLVVTNSASDSDIPANTLSFSLVTGAPPGASIGISSGIFTWTPGESQGPGTYNVLVRVIDSGSPALSATNSFVVTVNESNRPPVLDAISDQAVIEGGSVNFTSTASDPDLPANVLTYTLAAGAPAGAAITTNGVFTWNPTETDGGAVYTLTVEVTDNGSPTANDSQTFSITVTETNTAPVLSAIANRTINEGDSVVFTNTATDADVPAHNVTFSLDAGSPSGASVDSVTGVFSWTPTESQAPATNTITVRATDDGSPALSGTQTLTVVVNEVNEAPGLAAISDKTIVEGNLLVFTNAASDSDLPANTLVYSLDAGAPAGAGIDSETGILTWTPTEDQGPGTYPITVRITDSGTPALHATATFNVTVEDTNSAPVLSAISNQTIAEGTTFSITNVATDSDIPANILAFSLETNAPAGAVIISSNGVITWPTTENDGGSVYTFTVLVSDDGSPPLSDSQSFSVTVAEVNVAPTLSAIADQTVSEGVTVMITNAAADSDLPANSLTFTLDPGFPTGAAVDPVSGVFTWTPAEAQGPGVYPITVRVTDNGTPILSDTRTFTINVEETNVAPVLSVVTDQTIVEGGSLVFTNAAADADLPANTLTFSLDVNAPSGAGVNPTNGVFSWTPSESQGGAVYSFTLYVTDDGSPTLGDAQSFLVTVLDTNTAPSLAAIADQTIAQGSTLTFTNIASDLDVPADILTFSLDAGFPSGATIHASSGVFTWTPGEAQSPGIYPVTVRVTDSGSPQLSDSKTFNITLTEVNIAPVLDSIADRTVVEGMLVTFTNVAADVDLNLLTFSLSNAPAGAVINLTNGVFSWSVTEAQGPGVYTIGVQVIDNGTPPLSDMKTFSVTVTETNAAPALAAITNRTIIEGTALAFTNVATDIDFPANAITFSLSNSPAGASIGETSGIFTWTPTEAQGPADYVITVYASDNGSPALNSSQTFTVSVLETNAAPVLAAISNSTIDEATTLIVTNSASDSDQPANTLTYSLETNAPAGAFIDPITGTLTWTPTEAQGPSTNNITVRVTDNGSPAITVERVFTAVVNEVNLAPSLSAMANRVVHAGTTVTVTSQASDADLPVNVLNFSLDPTVPDGASINPSNGLFTWTPTDNQIGTNLLTVRVADNGTPGSSDIENFNIIVLPRPSLSIEPVGANVLLSWDSIAGQVYALQYKSDLSAVGWTLLTNVTATDSSMTLSDLVGSEATYYRILVP